MVILRKHRTDDVLAFIMKFPYWREALQAQMLRLVGQPWHSCMEAVVAGNGLQRVWGSEQSIQHQHQGWLYQTAGAGGAQLERMSRGWALQHQEVQTGLGLKFTHGQRGGKQHMEGCTGDQRGHRAAKGGRKTGLRNCSLWAGLSTSVSTSHHQGPSFIYCFLKGWVLATLCGKKQHELAAPFSLQNC